MSMTQRDNRPTQDAGDPLARSANARTRQLRRSLSPWTQRQLAAERAAESTAPSTQSLSVLATFRDSLSDRAALVLERATAWRGIAGPLAPAKISQFTTQVAARFPDNSQKFNLESAKREETTLPLAHGAAPQPPTPEPTPVFTPPPFVPPPFTPPAMTEIPAPAPLPEPPRRPAPVPPSGRVRRFSRVEEVTPQKPTTTSDVQPASTAIPTEEQASAPPEVRPISRALDSSVSSKSSPSDVAASPESSETLVHVRDEASEKTGVEHLKGMTAAAESLQQFVPTARSESDVQASRVAKPMAQEQQPSPPPTNVSPTVEKVVPSPRDETSDETNVGAPAAGAPTAQRTHEADRPSPSPMLPTRQPTKPAMPSARTDAEDTVSIRSGTSLSAVTQPPHEIEAQPSSMASLPSEPYRPVEAATGSDDTVARTSAETVASQAASEAALQLSVSPVRQPIEPMEPPARANAEDGASTRLAAPHPHEAEARTTTITPSSSESPAPQITETTKPSLVAREADEPSASTATPTTSTVQRARETSASSPTLSRFSAEPAMREIADAPMPSQPTREMDNPIGSAEVAAPTAAQQTSEGDASAQMSSRPSATPPTNEIAADTTSSARAAAQAIEPPTLPRTAAKSVSETSTTLPASQRSSVSQPPQMGESTVPLTNAPEGVQKKPIDSPALAETSMDASSQASASVEGLAGEASAPSSPPQASESARSEPIGLSPARGPQTEASAQPLASDVKPIVQAESVARAESSALPLARRMIEVNDTSVAVEPTPTARTTSVTEPTALRSASAPQPVLEETPRVESQFSAQPAIQPAQTTQKADEALAASNIPENAVESVAPIVQPSRFPEVQTQADTIAHSEASSMPLAKPTHGIAPTFPSVQARPETSEMLEPESPTRVAQREDAGVSQPTQEIGAVAPTFGPVQLAPEPEAMPRFAASRAATRHERSEILSRLPLMRTPRPSAHHEPARTALPPALLQRIKQTELVTQGWRFKTKADETATTNEAIQRATEALQTPEAGQPLPAQTRATLEPILQRDLSEVRVHRAPLSGLNVEAATRGRDVFVSPAQAQLNSPEALQLLGHELTHVAQQGFAQREPMEAESRLPQPSGFASEADTTVQRAVVADEAEAEQAEQAVAQRLMTAPATLEHSGLPLLRPQIVQRRAAPAAAQMPRESESGEAENLVTLELPAAPDPLSGHLMRERGDAPETSSATTTTETMTQPSAPATPDLDALARQIYPLLKRMLQVEKERTQGLRGR